MGPGFPRPSPGPYIHTGTGLQPIGADFRFEVPGQSSVGLIGGGNGQWLGGHHGECGARAYNGVWGQSPQRGPGAEPVVSGSGGRSPPEAESILVIECPTEPANLAPLVKFSKLSCNVHLKNQSTAMKSKKGKVFPYSLPSVGPGADPGVQAVSPQVT